jgi:hypothetical protein
MEGTLVVSELKGNLYNSAQLSSIRALEMPRQVLITRARITKSSSHCSNSAVDNISIVLEQYNLTLRNY